MTGRYPQRCVWVDDAELSQVFREQRKKNMKQRWAFGISTDELTIADVLKKAGYRTALIGKWHLGYDSKFHPMNYGFDEFRGFVGGNVDYHTHIAEFGLQELDWWNGKKIENQGGYSTDLLTQYTVDFIVRHKKVPFFLCLTHESPHKPLQGRNPKEKKSPAATYKEMIEVLDESVGVIVDTISRHGIKKNTLIIFCSDNGAAPPQGISANGQWQGEKGSMFEGGHRVPCIASWPGTIAPGSMSHDTVMTMDFFPTFAAIAEAVISEDHQIDGVDILGILKGQEAIKPRVLYWLLGDSWAVRKGYWKLIGKGNIVTMLANLDEDPAETKHFEKKFPERVNELMTLQQAWVKTVGSR
jgi:arylsulfatase A-like enzyme